MSERFYSEHPVSVGEIVALDDLQSHHLLHVMRAGVGDLVQVFDGGPHAFGARVASKDRRTVRLEILAELPLGTSPHAAAVLVAAPPPKGDRFRFLIEKLTEMGATTYQPILTQRSVNPLTPSLLKKAQQWVIEACKQSGRNRLLTIQPVADLTAVVAALASVPERIAACVPGDLGRATVPAPPDQSRPPCPAAGGEAGGSQPPLQTTDVAIVVGPEGGLTPQELDLLASSGWRSIQIGPHVLRIETAAVAVLASFWGRSQLGKSAGNG